MNAKGVAFRRALNLIGEDPSSQYAHDYTYQERRIDAEKLMKRATIARTSKKAPPAGIVKSVRHCGDTYFVTTADGILHKVWEFNLRLKIDTSARGPAPGKPVVVGAGMQGDRASIVFAAREGRIAYKHIGPLTPRITSEELMPLIEKLRR